MCVCVYISVSVFISTPVKHPATIITAYAGVGNFCVYPRLHVVFVVWNFFCGKFFSGKPGGRVEGQRSKE